MATAKTPVEKSLRLHFDKERETKGTWRYSERGTEYIKTIYLNKEQVAKLGSPETLEITIKPGTPAGGK